MERLPAVAAVEYRQRLRAELAEHLASVDVDALTLTELKDLLVVLRGAARRKERARRSAPRPRA